MVDTKKLEEVAVRLNKTSDELNVTLKKIQDKINRLNIGLEVWMEKELFSQDMEMREDDNGNIICPFPEATSMAHQFFLGYAKTSEGWGLALQKREVYYSRSNRYGMSVVGSYNITDPEPLQKASREIRIIALKELPSLINDLLEKAEAAIADIEDARKLADEL